MTYPAPTQSRKRRRVSYEEELELEARRSVHAGVLPANLERAQVSNSDWYADSAVTLEQQQRGWTAQQPFAHVDCDVMVICVFCARSLDPDYLRQHDCPVLEEVESA